MAFIRTDHRPLLERLRGRKAFGLNGATWVMLNAPDPDCQESAAEIDRLSAEVASAQAVCDSYAKENQQFSDEIERLRAGLNIIAQAGTVHGGAWCVAQAYGYLNDLDFNEYPKTGKAANEQATE